MKKAYIILIVIFLIIVIGAISGILWYTGGQKSTGINKETIIEIPSGTSTTEILNNLEQNKVIKNKTVAKIYIGLHEVKNLQAGKYQFTGNETLQEVLQILASGKVMDETIKITFVEGKNMRYIASMIAENTDNTANDVYDVLEDEKYITSLIDKYWFLTKDIQDEYI